MTLQPMASVAPVVVVVRVRLHKQLVRRYHGSGSSTALRSRREVVAGTADRHLYL